MCPRKLWYLVRSDTEEELLERIVRRYEYFKNTKIYFCSKTSNRGDKQETAITPKDKFFSLKYVYLLSKFDIRSTNWKYTV